VYKPRDREVHSALIINHANDSCGIGFLPAFVCLFIRTIYQPTYQIWSL